MENRKNTITNKCLFLDLWMIESPKGVLYGIKRYFYWRICNLVLGILIDFRADGNSSSYCCSGWNNTGWFSSCFKLLIFTALAVVFINFTVERDFSRWWFGTRAKGHDLKCYVPAVAAQNLEATAFHLICILNSRISKIAYRSCCLSNCVLKSFFIGGWVPSW